MNKKAPKKIKKNIKPKMSVKISKKDKITPKKPLDKSFEKLLKAWYLTTLNNKDVSFGEILNRLSTLCRSSFEELGISVEDAQDIFYSFYDNYAHQMGYDMTVCSDCQKEAENLEENPNKLLN